MSVMEQRFEDYELIIQDGLSSDNTLEVIKNIQNKYPLQAIKIFSEQDNGIYDAMNKATLNASGQWIYFLGSDDYLYTKDVLDVVHKAISKRDTDIIYGDVYSESHKGVYGGKFTYERLMDFNICHQAIFTKKEVLLRFGLFNTCFTGLADWDLNTRLFKGKVKARHIPLIIAHFSEGGFSFDCMNDSFLPVLESKRKDYNNTMYVKFKNQLKKLFPRKVITSLKKIEKTVR